MSNLTVCIKNGNKPFTFDPNVNKWTVNILMCK